MSNIEDLANRSSGLNKVDFYIDEPIVLRVGTGEFPWINAALLAAENEIVAAAGPAVEATSL